jgi:hypothetical protein
MIVEVMLVVSRYWKVEVETVWVRVKPGQVEFSLGVYR